VSAGVTCGDISGKKLSFAALGGEFVKSGTEPVRAGAGQPVLLLGKDRGQQFVPEGAVRRGVIGEQPDQVGHCGDTGRVEGTLMHRSGPELLRGLGPPLLLW
jgi:hypothetical protein